MRARTIKEGSLGLFIFGGLSLLGVVLIWLTGATFGRTTYIVNVNFEDANGLKEGAVVRYRGLEIGRVSAVEPNSNGVNVQIEVNSADLVMPKDSLIETNQAGLVGEPDIEIVPGAVLSEAAIAQSPLARDCAELGEIICHEDDLQGVIGVSFEETLRLTQQFSRAYSDEEFVALIASFAESSTSAAEQLKELTAELTLLSRDVRGEVGSFSENAQSITDNAQSITDAAVNSATQLRQTMGGINELTTNLNALVVENRQTLVGTLDSISRTSDQMQSAIASLDTALGTLNSSLAATDTRQLVQNLETLTNNAAIASSNLKDLSVTLNDPANITILQKTLDAARVTFENTQKITSDLDELTGDPTFRQNLIDLVNGLSQLVSSTEQLQDQIQVAAQIEPMRENLSKRDLATRRETPEASQTQDYQ